ncbi:Phosphatase PSR1 [Diplonema papillatum]|nr:Phosphatase PSR1 [Diplonema papillatum]
MTSATKEQHPHSADERLISKDRKRWKKTVVVDMDETLLHSMLASPANGGKAPPSATAERQGNKICIRWSDGFGLDSHLRPGAEHFLAFLAGRFEVVLWTAGTYPYAKEVLKVLDPEDAIFSHVIWRDSRWFRPELDGRGYAKELARLGRELETVVVIDNDANVCRFNLPHAVIVSDWDRSAVVGNKNDTEFATIMSVLEDWASKPDLRASELLAATPLLHHTDLGNKISAHATFPLPLAVPPSTAHPAKL